MIVLDSKEACCGCAACFAVCPKNAISMVTDMEGFWYPSVDADKCIGCNLCIKKCPIENKPKSNDPTSEGYILRIKDEEVLKESTSGGAFTAIALYFLNQGAAVYGAGYDRAMNVVCKKAETIAQLEEMRGSKFVQSDMSSAFEEIRSELSNNRKVLFTGTPCQVAALKNFIGNNENLVCVDFVCRGVPSPGVWNSYVQEMERKFQSKMNAVKFKNKTYGYHASTMKVEFENGKKWVASGRIDPMMKAFVKELVSRPSCGECKFKGLHRYSDITIFDCYGFKKITKRKDDDKGYSSLFINSETGRDIIQFIAGDVELIRASIEELVGENGVMVSNCAKPNEKRQLFFELHSQYGLERAMNMVMPISKKDFLIERTKGILYRLHLIQLAKRLKNEKVEIRH